MSDTGSRGLVGLERFEARRINEIVRGLRSISADTALRLARYFGTSERFWLNLQARYDLEVQKDRLGARLSREVKVRVLANVQSCHLPGRHSDHARGIRSAAR